jgi:phosphatidate cytidylyltransferase
MNHKRAFSYAGICLLSLATMFMYASMDLVKILLFVTVLFWLIVVPYLMKQSLSLNIAKWRWPLAILGLLIFPTGWFALMHLRGGGLSVLISVLVLVWCADIGAYFAGKSFGKHKLAIHLSPGKSIEGAIGGWLVVMCIAFTYIKINQYLDLSSSNFFSILQDEFGWSGVFGVSTLCVLMSIQGDLFESQLKRVAGVKDSSNLLPGHGGILDRIDALLPVLPVAALITTFLV